MAKSESVRLFAKIGPDSATSRASSDSSSVRASVRTPWKSLATRVLRGLARLRANSYFDVSDFQTPSNNRPLGPKVRFAKASLLSGAVRARRP